MEIEIRFGYECINFDHRSAASEKKGEALVAAAHVLVATCWKPVTATNNTSATTNRSIGRLPNDRLKMASPATAYEP
jgi:hypothetical protein